MEHDQALKFTLAVFFERRDTLTLWQKENPKLVRLCHEFGREKLPGPIKLSSVARLRKLVELGLSDSSDIHISDDSFF